MSPLESDHETSCPYCMSVFMIRLDQTGGSRQSFVVDCETCCRPIEVEVQIESDGYVQLIVKREGEG